MPTDLEQLVELQRLDAEIASLQAQLDAIPKTLARIDAQLATARRRVQEAQDALKAGDAEKRRHDQEIQSLNEQIIKFRSQSSGVKTNEQYKALLSEIAHAEAQISSHEEKIIEIMLNADTLQGGLKEAETALKAESVEIERQKSEAQREADADTKALEELRARGRQLREALDENLVATYDRIRNSRGNALAEVREERCTACQVLLRPQLYSNLRSGGGIIQCDSCTRLLYYVPENNISTAAANASGVGHQEEREWMFVPELGTNGAFAIFTNHKGNATMKAYDAVSGEAIARRVEKNATYQSIFASELRNARNLFVDEAGVENKFKEQLPPEFVEDLRHQLPDS